MQGLLNPSATFWRGKRVLITGHTGFKGAWLSLWLRAMHAEVHGLALPPPTTPNLFEQAEVARGMRSSTMGDIRDVSTVQRCMSECRPEIVIHMAAQPLVRSSYVDPIGTYSTNVMGTVHVLDTAMRVGGVQAIVNVTTDKCYENREWHWGYRENEPMGGFDPYSNSKGCSELVTAAYRQSFMHSEGPRLASARAGNVIGGGDWALDRLVPDTLRAFQANVPVRIRNPHATRPWQHVLEPLSGYLALAERMHASEGRQFAEAWNFGPEDDDAKPVQWIVERLCRAWGQGSTWTVDDAPQPHEAAYLKLDISKAKARLGWRPRWTLGTALQEVCTWQQAWLAGRDVRAVCEQQIDTYTHTTLDTE